MPPHDLNNAKSKKYDLFGMISEVTCNNNMSHRHMRNNLQVTMDGKCSMVPPWKLCASFPENVNIPSIQTHLKKSLTKKTNNAGTVVGSLLDISGTNSGMYMRIDSHQTNTKRGWTTDERQNCIKAQTISVYGSRRKASKRRLINNGVQNNNNAFQSEWFPLQIDQSTSMDMGNGNNANIGISKRTKKVVMRGKRKTQHGSTNCSRQRHGLTKPSTKNPSKNLKNKLLRRKSCKKLNACVSSKRLVQKHGSGRGINLSLNNIINDEYDLRNVTRKTLSIKHTADGSSSQSQPNVSVGTPSTDSAWIEYFFNRLSLLSKFLLRSHVAAFLPHDVLFGGRRTTTEERTVCFTAGCSTQKRPTETKAVEEIPLDHNVSPRNELTASNISLTPAIQAASVNGKADKNSGNMKRPSCGDVPNEFARLMQETKSLVNEIRN